MTVKIIGFFGLAGAGKSLAAGLAEAECDTLGYMSMIRPFAGPLKEGLAMMGIRKDTHPVLYRQAAQLMGTEICRKESEDWWVDQMRHTISDMPDDGMLVIDDVRFENEFKLLDEYESIKIFVDAGERLDLTQKLYRHPSERVAMNFHSCLREMYDTGEMMMPPLVQTDFILDNNSDIPAMSRQLNALLEQFTGD